MTAIPLLLRTFIRAVPLQYVEYGKVGQEPPAAKLASLVTPTVTLPPVSPSNQSASQLPAAASVPPATQVPSSSNAASAPGTQRQAGVIGGCSLHATFLYSLYRLLGIIRLSS